MRILIVEDSEKLQRYVGLGLSQAGFSTDAARNGAEGLRLATENDYDAIILDLMLPGLDGLTVLDRLRKAGRDTPILVLTAKDTVEDRVHGLQQGADDYLVKPFAFEELTARLHAIIRRRYGRDSSLITCGDLTIDTTACAATWAGKSIDLTRREYLLLQYLASRVGDVVTRTTIEEHIYDQNATLMSNVVDSTICALRRKFDAVGAGSIIQTRRGLGYTLQPEAV